MPERDEPQYTDAEAREAAQRIVDAFDHDMNVSLGDAWVVAYTYLNGSKGN